MAWSLGVDDQWRLVHAFLRLDGMRRRVDRDLYIDLLENELGHRLPITRDDRDMYDVLHLVKSCQAYPGAVRVLTTVVRHFYGDASAMQEIQELVEELFPEPLISPRERRELHRLVQELDGAGLGPAHRAAIGDLYRNAVGPLGPHLDRDTGDLRQVLMKLEDLTVGPDGVPPLLVFVENLAARADGPAAAGLRAWSDRLAGRLGLTSGTTRAIRGRAARALETAGPYGFLIIEFRPDPICDDRYLTSAWLQVDGEHGAMLRCDDEDPLPLEELPRVVEELLTDPRVVNRPCTELMIEFVLPRGLLGVPVDQFPVTIEGFRRRLGIEYPVVVRSFDRLRSRAMHHNWRRKWAWLRDNPTRAQVFWMRRDEPDGHERLYTALVSERSSVCAALAFPPRTGHGGPPEELWVGLHAGMPIALWCRRDRDPDRFSAECLDLLDQGALALPENVLELRRKALRSSEEAPVDDHLGFQLTLMFDDADRLPEPYVRLGAPA